MKLKTETWIAWCGTLVAGCLALAAYAFTTFETKEHAQEVKGDVTSRLERIENKIDRMLIRRR